MIGINRVTLLGRVAAEPEKRETKSGKPMVKIVVAIPGMRESQSTVEYFDVVAWNGTAEACSKFVSKGMPIFVDGRLSKRVWEETDGKKRSKISVSAQRIVFLGSKSAAPENGDLPPGAEPVPDLESLERDRQES
jgi:single-strand DNA-binding protein